MNTAGHLFLRQHRFDEALAIDMVPEDRLAPESEFMTLVALKLRA